MISKKHAVEQIRTKQEPLIRFPISTGLATGRTKVEALLGGVLEVIERDAFMIMWMNTLSLPCIQIDSILTSNEVLAELHRTCARYLLSIKYVQLITDAPAHVVMAVVSDESSLSTPHPYTSVGLCASSSLTRACEKALLEALRGRKNARARLAKHPEWLMKKPSEVYHTERGVYWCALERKPALTFLTAGQAIVVPEAVWEKDSEEAYLERLIAWANEKQYDIVSVSLTDSHKNPTQWHIENVCIPQLQPMHQRESYIYDSGKRLESIPELFGYKPRAKPFLEHPHPFV
jgi:ribosomal protein S12 methylthiotransferase accessory factor